MSSADNFCKQFGPRSGPTKRRALSGSNLFDTQMVFLKEFFKKVDFEKNQQTTKKHEKFPRGQKFNNEIAPLDWLHMGFKVQRYFKFGNFCDNLIFANSAKRHICNVKKLRLGYDLPTSVFAISGGLIFMKIREVPFHENKPSQNNSKFAVLIVYFKNNNFVLKR